MVSDDTRLIRKAKAIASRTTEILIDLSEMEDSAQCWRLAQALVADCVSLSGQWRAEVAYIGDASEFDDYVDFRSLGEVLRVVCKQTHDLYFRVSAIVQQAQMRGDTIPHEDLILAVREIQNVAA